MILFIKSLKYLRVLPLTRRLLSCLKTEKMIEGEGKIDWGLAECIAFSSVARDGQHVRLSGQDCRRGTFSHRHAVIRDFENGASLNVLNQATDGKQTCDVINSSLSEQGVLGFEFGYSVADRDALVMWEAQFGDFSNGAQIVIDQFLVASEAKWKQASVPRYVVASRLRRYGA